MMLVASAADLRHDDGDRRRRAPAQHRRSAGMPWSAEVSEDILYLVTLLAAPWLLRQGQHIRVDIVLRALPRALAWRLEWVGDAARPCLLPLFRVVRLPASRPRAISTGAISIKTLVMPEWWMLAPLPVAFAAARHRVPVPHAPACPCGARRRAERCRRLGRSSTRPHCVCPGSWRRCCCLAARPCCSSSACRWRCRSSRSTSSARGCFSAASRGWRRWCATASSR